MQGRLELRTPDPKKSQQIRNIQNPLDIHLLLKRPMVFDNRMDATSKFDARGGGIGLVDFKRSQMGVTPVWKNLWSGICSLVVWGIQEPQSKW